MESTKQKHLFERAKKVIPGGVNSPVRAFKSVGGTPIFFARGKGSQLTDVDGKTYLDYVSSWGPLIFGHADEDILQALNKAAANGTSFGAPTEAEILLAEKIVSMVPTIQKIRLVNSGTEATMSALRLARAFTEREKIIKFSGGYHGHVDSLLVAAGSGSMTLGVPDSDGVNTATIKDTIVLPYNSKETVTAAFKKCGKELAAIIVEPVSGNMGCVAPENGFLEHLSQMTREYGSLLIFDEVMTGFRLAKGGAQERYGIKPDITCLGKIIGGGLPVGAFGGRTDIMDHLAPLGKTYQAGTLSGNPLAVAAGLTMLEKLSQKGVYETLEEKGKFLGDGLRRIIKGGNFPLTLNQVGSMFTLFFHPGPITSFETAKNADAKRFAEFFHALLEEGIYFPPSQFEAAFLSLAHSNADLEQTLKTIERILPRILA